MFENVYVHIKLLMFAIFETIWVQTNGYFYLELSVLEH